MKKLIKRTMALVLTAALFITGSATMTESGVAKASGNKITIDYAPDFTTVFRNYITVDGTKLMDGDKELKFISLNYPQATSDTAWEAENAVKTIKTMGGNVTRSYTIPVYNGQNTATAYVTGVDAEGKLTFNENALVNLDNLLASCNKHGIRLIIPLVDHWHWIGGMDGYVWLAGEADGDPSQSGFQDWAWKFFSSEKCMDYFKQMISHLLERENTVTGVKYKDDPAILCWETANEAGGNPTLQKQHDAELTAWNIEVVNHIKSIDDKHLVLDGRMSMTEASLAEDNPADIMGAHYYEGNYAVRCAEDTQMAHAAGKPFILGEFGAKVEAEPCIEVFQAGIDNDTNGIMMWSLRAHKDGYGYYFHSEDGYWASYHWPGFESGNYYGETEIIRSIYAYAQIANGKASNYEEAKKIPIPAPEKDEAPLLYAAGEHHNSFKDGSVGDIKWRGVVGGAWYEIQRADGVVTEDADDSVWTTIADEEDYVYDSGRNWEDKSKDCIAGYHDETAIDGQTYSYRLRACNESGVGLWSNIVTVEDAKHVVVDDLDLIAVSSTDPNPTEIRNTYSYDHSANVEYSSSSIVNQSETEGYIEYKAIIPVKDVVVKSIFETEEGAEPKVYVSQDGMVYKELTVEHAAGTAEYTSTTASEADNYYYTRVYLAGNSKCKLDSITITYANDGNSYLEEEIVVDTNTIIQDNKFGIDAEPLYGYKTSNLGAVEGSVSGITVQDDAEGTIIYKTADDINAYRVVAYAKDGMTPKIEYSFDGIGFNASEELETAEEEGYTKIVAGNLTVGETVRYIRVTFPAGSKDKVVLKSVEISSGVKSIPLTESAPANTFEDGEYYFGDSSNVEAAYEISVDGKAVKYAKALNSADYTEYDCVFAWIESDGSGNELTLQITDKNNTVWTSQPYVLEEAIGSMHKFAFADFTCGDENAVMDLSEVLSFEFVITGGSKDASVSLDGGHAYTGNYGVALQYAKQKTIYVDSVYASSSTKVDDYEGYSGSNNLLNAAYTRNTNGGIFNMSMDSTHKSQGSYGVRIDYSYEGKGYAGATKTMDLLNLAGYDGFMMFVDSDGSNNDIKVQIETDISTFSYTGYLSGEGPMTYYMPFSAMKEESWAGTGHVLDSTQNLKSVSIYTDLIDEVTSGTFYVDDLKGANYVQELEAETAVTLDFVEGTEITSFPYAITGTAKYVDYISLKLGDKVINVPVNEDDTWSYELTAETGIFNDSELKMQAGFYYPNGEIIAKAVDKPIKFALNVDGNDAPVVETYDTVAWDWDFATDGTEGWTFEGFEPWVEENSLVAWSVDEFDATFSYTVKDIPNGIYTLENDIKVKSNMNNVQMALKDGSNETKSLAINTEDVMVEDMLLGEKFEVTNNQVTVVYYVSAPTDANGATFAAADLKLYLVEEKEAAATEQEEVVVDKGIVEEEEDTEATTDEVVADNSGMKIGILVGAAVVIVGGVVFFAVKKKKKNGSKKEKK